MDQEAELPHVSRGDFELLCKAANDNVAGALDHLRQLLDAQPAIWQRVGDMALLAELKLIELIAGGNKLLAESLQRKFEALRTDLVRPAASPIERLAAERVAATWLQLQHAQSQLTSSAAGSAVSKDWLHRLTQVDRSHAAALRALHNLQRLTPISASPTSETIKPAPAAQPNPHSAESALQVFTPVREAVAQASDPTPLEGADAGLRSTGS